MTDTKTDTGTRVHAFFTAYAEALLARDERAVAELYAVPALILFPGNAVPVGDRAETEAFFASSWEQYAGVADADFRARVMGEGPGTVWADVTWSYDGAVRERFCYQLVAGSDGVDRIAVLTPLELPAD